MPSAHAITGCDSVSSFHGMGKKNLAKLTMGKTIDNYTNLKDLSQNFTQVGFEATERMIVALYMNHERKAQLPQFLISEQKWQKLKHVSLTKRPPSLPCFHQHVKHASWQTQVLMHSHETQPDIPSPVGHRWQRDECGGIIPCYFEGPTASEIMEGLLCACSDQGETCQEDCSCEASQLLCMELCQCHAGE